MTRVLAVFCWLFVLCLPVFAEPVIEGGRGLTGVAKLGEPVQDVLTRLNSKAERTPVEGMDFFQVGNPNLLMGTAPGEDPVSYIMVLTPDYATPGGLRVGDNAGVARAQLGTDFQHIGPGQNTAFQYYYPKQGLMLSFDTSEKIISLGVVKRGWQIWLPLVSPLSLALVFLILLFKLGLLGKPYAHDEQLMKKRVRQFRVLACAGLVAALGHAAMTISEIL